MACGSELQKLKLNPVCMFQGSLGVKVVRLLSATNANIATFCQAIITAHARLLHVPSCCLF